MSSLLTLFDQERPSMQTVGVVLAQQGRSPLTHLMTVAVLNAKVRGPRQMHTREDWRLTVRDDWDSLRRRVGNLVHLPESPFTG